MESLLFHFWFYLFEFSFFLDESGKQFVNFVYLFKEPAPGFIDPWIFFLVSMSFNSALIFVISFLLLALGFVCCSSSSCRCRVRFFVWNISLFYVGLAMNFLLRTAFTVSHKFWTVVWSFPFVSRNFLISSLILFLTHLLFNRMLFNIH